MRGRGTQAALIFGDGALYGTTGIGGAGCEGGCGTAFEVAPPAAPGGAWAETVLHAFTPFDGTAPQPPLAINRNGTLFGTTAGGGSVFVLKPPAAPGGTWSEGFLFDSFAPGNIPLGLVIARNGTLYGTTQNGGTSGNGTVYELVP